MTRGEQVGMLEVEKRKTVPFNHYFLIINSVAGCGKGLVQPWKHPMESSLVFVFNQREASIIQQPTILRSPAPHYPSSHIPPINIIKIIKFSHYITLSCRCCPLLADVILLIHVIMQCEIFSIVTNNCLLPTQCASTRLRCVHTIHSANSVRASSSFHHVPSFASRSFDIRPPCSICTTVILAFVGQCRCCATSHFFAMFPPHTTSSPHPIKNNNHHNICD